MIHPIEAVHAAGDVYHQAQAFGLLLWATQLREGKAEKRGQLGSRPGSRPGSAVSAQGGQV